MAKRPKHLPFRKPKKVPVIAQEPEIGKVPRAVAGPGFHHLRPSWRVSSIEMVEPFGWHRITGDTLKYIRERLAQFETMTWAEILIKAKKQNHSIKVEAICTSAQRRLDSLKLFIEDVVSLRLSARERVYGYLENGVLILLWWDPEHQICPSFKD